VRMKYLVLSILALAAMAQAPSPEPPTGSIGGLVKDATTHAPLSGVVVNGGRQSATTGPQGQFVLQKIEAGRQWVSAHDESRAASGGISVLLNPGQDATGIEISIKLGGSISGQVLDEDRHPVAGAAVVLLESRFEFGQPAYAPSLTARTDRDGVYRLAPVPAERAFRIMTNKPVKLLDAAAPLPADPEKRPRLPMPAWYPNSSDVYGAEAVALNPSEDRQDVNIRMALAPAYCIDGSVTAPGGTAIPSVSIAGQLPLSSGWSLTPVTAQTAADGKFHACGFPPGEYQLTAGSDAEARSQRVYAFGQAAIATRDLEDVQLAARPGIAIAGETVWDPPPRDRASEARISIGLKKWWNSVKHADEEQPRSSFGGILEFGGRIQVPGPFTLERLPIDDYGLDVRSLPEGCYVKDATYGGASVLHEPMRLTRSADGRLHLALACDGGSLTARVTDRDGNPVSNAHLYVMPEETASAAALPDVLRQQDIEKGWSAAVAPLPPGKYLVLACGVETDGTAEPILKLWQARSKAKDVSIAPGETAQITLEISDID